MVEDKKKLQQRGPMERFECCQSYRKMSRCYFSFFPGLVTFTRYGLALSPFPSWDGVSNSDTYKEGIDSKCLGSKSKWSDGLGVDSSTSSISDAMDEIDVPFGSGERIPVHWEPWFAEWEDYLRYGRERTRQATVANLWDSTQQKWNEEQMLQNWSQQAVIKIRNSVHKANPNATYPDTLVLRLTPNGRYNVKRDTFSLLENKIALLTHAYGESFAGIIPRVKTFLWRACQDALPVMDVLHRIIRLGRLALCVEWKMHLHWPVGSRDLMVNC